MASKLDQLFTELREALDAKAVAGYEGGKYVGNQDADSQPYLVATARADELTTALWRKLYDLAPVLTDALDVHEAVRGLEAPACVCAAQYLDSAIHADECPKAG